MKTILTILLILISTDIYPQEKKEEPTDSVLSACLEANPSTHGCIRCYTEAYNAWEEEMNRYMKYLNEILPEEEKKLLQDSQSKWHKYSSAELLFSERYYTKMDGTMYQIFNADRGYELQKMRTLELRSYYLTYTEGTK